MQQNEEKRKKWRENEIINISKEIAKENNGEISAGSIILSYQ